MAMKQRASKMNTVQREYLIDFMSTNKEFAAGRLSSPMGYESQGKTWTMLADALNLKGPTKDVEQWKKAWSDIKSKTRSKVSDIKADHNRTGNITRDGDLPLSGSDQKVLAILGRANVEGVRGVADSLPDSVHSLSKLIAGDQSALFDEVEDFSIFEACAGPSTTDQSRKVNSPKNTNISKKTVEVEAAEVGPSSRPTSAEANPLARHKRDSRVIELLAEQNDLMRIIASNGTRLNEILEELVAVKKRKLALP